MMDLLHSAVSVFVCMLLCGVDGVHAFHKTKVMIMIQKTTVMLPVMSESFMHRRIIGLYK